MCTASETVGQMVSERPARARVFEEAGIDYYSVGQQTLAEACRKKGLDPDSVLDRLAVQDRREDSAVRNWSEVPLGELCNCVESMFHSQLKEELPRIGILLYRVSEGHAQRHPELSRVLEIYSLLSGDLKLHMIKEEDVLFPMIKQLDETDGPASRELIALIEQAESEHLTAMKALREVRSLTCDFKPPSDASGAYRAVLDALCNLENSLQDHFGVESNILFPRVFQTQFSAV